MKNFYKLLSIFTLFALSSGLCQAQVDNYCLRLSQGGSVDCGPMPELDGLSSFTVQLWFNADQWTEGATLLSRGEDFSVKLGKSNIINLKMRGASFSVRSNDFIVGKWVPLMILSSSNSVQVYVDNALERTVSTSRTQPETGARFVFGGDNYNGRIDEVRIWNAELASDYEYFTHTTLNKWVPQLTELVAYFKFDQPWCDNVVDYKPLFDKKIKLNHHGIFSSTGAQREKVTDNDAGLPYLLMGGYTNTERFFDNAIEVDKYLLSNDLIILGLKSYSDGHVRPITSNDHATVRNCEYMENYNTTKFSGVISLKGGRNSYLICPENVFSPSTGFTLETWICIVEWTEGAYIFRKENTTLGKGFSLRLGSEKSKELIARVDGREYFFTNTLQKGSWRHLAVTPGTGKNALICNVNGRVIGPNAQSDTTKNVIPADMSGMSLSIGYNLNAVLDETMIWNFTQDFDEIAKHRNGNVEMPGPGKALDPNKMWTNLAYYRYDYPDDLGFDCYSQDGWAKIMESCYDGYTGFQIRISVKEHDGWQSTIADANKRKIFAADLAKESKYYDGVELDLEWMDGTQTNLGLLADEILAVLPEGKTFMISHHQYGAYMFPKDKINKLDGYTFQQYGPQKEKKWYSLSAFKNGYNNFINYGYPKDKIYLSYGTTLTNGYNANGSYGRAPIGYSWGIIGDDYVPATNGAQESATWGGYTFYFCGPVQVYNRAKFVRDNQVKGLFYWDICNDLSPSHKHSLTRNANYALNANVDPRVDTAIPNYPTPTAINTILQDDSENSFIDNNTATYDLQGRRINPSANYRGIVIQNGKKIMK